MHMPDICRKNPLRICIRNPSRFCRGLAPFNEVNLCPVYPKKNRRLINDVTYVLKNIMGRGVYADFGAEYTLILH